MAFNIEQNQCDMERPIHEKCKTIQTWEIIIFVQIQKTKEVLCQQITIIKFQAPGLGQRHTEG